MDYFALLVDFATPAYDQTVGLRNKILKIPLNVEFDLEEIQNEYKDFHLACYDENAQLIACLVLTPLTDKIIKMRQVAVDVDFQKQGVGAYLVEISEAIASKKGFTKMELNARDTVIPFYQKLKYKKIGKQFTEVGIKHFKMYKKLVQS